MDSSTAHFIPILFKILFGFVCLNMVVSFILLYTRQLRLTKIMAIYWPTVLVYYLIQGQFQEGNLNIILAYYFGYATSLLISMIGFESVGRKFPLMKYLALLIPCYPLTLWLHSHGYGFTAIAMPISIVAALPMLHGAWYLLRGNQGKPSTRLQKVLGVVFLVHAVHAVNFAIFRMDPGAQLWGWLTSYALCDFLAILLPSIALEQYTLSEKERLQKLVDQRTEELNQSVKTNDTLFKVLIHDISNPLMVIKGYLHVMKEKRDNLDMLIDRMQKSQLVIENIINQVKSLHLLKGRNKMPLAPVALEDCFKEVSFIFEDTLKRKNISLKINNQLKPNTFVLADHTSLTHSVLSNLVSNGIKFTKPNTKIEIIAKHDNENVVLEVKDEGPGIPDTVIEDVMQDKELSSTDGTQGEKGTGLGLSIAKSFVDSYGGSIEIDSSFMAGLPKDYGTNIRITLDRAP